MRHLLLLYTIEIKPKTLIHTLADRLTDVIIETPAELAAQRYAGALMNNLAYGLRRVDVETVNEKVAEVKGEALVDTVRHASTDGSRRTWQHTRKGEGLGSSGRTGRQTITG